MFHHGINISSMEDTMLMSYVLDAGKNRHNMDILSEIHLGHKPIKFKDLVGSGKKQLNFSEVDINKLKITQLKMQTLLYDFIRNFKKS